ncbi:PAS domain-containing protein [Kordiimonas aestuarii]|uniref:PAS domain-containing protein n=1 Tax=Kordiimonas aestuarii TaxID=1005925 RepID=UPI0021D34A26|nr:PAS domain-containing protein [Kordiimonas aestuarii]
MIETSFKIEDNLALQNGAFHKDIFNHWREILHGRRYPNQREFRPQKFPKYLPQIAIVSVSGVDEYDDRLTGDTVLEVLRLRQNHDRLVEPHDENVREVVRAMLNESALAGTPMYFKGKFQPDGAKPIDFTALVLPFSHNDETDILDTMMLAFDFSKHDRIELDFAAFAADHA